jgi:DHA1 family bicyclomycin/chloramphenicol resistance-like MFS transporter
MESQSMLRPGTFALTALLAALNAIGPLSTDMYLPSLPEIAHRLGASSAQVQLTISFYLIGFAVGQILYGPVSDRYGRKAVLLGALGVYCLASIACTFSTSVEMLYVGRAMQALGASGSLVVTRAIVRDLYSGARAGRELSLISSVMALGPVLAPVVGGALQTAFGWRSSFIALALIGVTSAAVVWALLPETMHRRVTEPFSLSSMLKSYGIVAQNPAFLAYLGLATFSYAGLFAWISAASFVLQNVYSLSPFNFGVVFALGAVGYMSGTAIATRLVVRIGLDSTMGLGACLLTVGGLCAVASVALGLTSAFTLVVPVAVYIAGLGMVLPQGIAGALTPFPERAGAASALFGFIQQSGAAFAGAVVGWLLGHTAWPLAGGVAIMGCATLVLWVLTRGVRSKAAVKH